MNFQFFALFLLLLIVPIFNSIYAENEKSNFENSLVPIQEFRSSSSSKIHSILIQWQLSENPNEFAKENQLSFAENKIGVYIYLESTESISKIPPDITVTAFDEKTVVAFVSSEQLDELNDLNFVERVTPPDLARTPPIPQVEIPQSQTREENPYDYPFWLVIGGIVIIAIGLFKKRIKLKD